MGGDEDRERRGEGDEGRAGDEGDEDRERLGEGDEGRAGDEGDEDRERRGEGDEEVSCWGKKDDRCVRQLRRVVVSAQSWSVGRREHRGLPQGHGLLSADSAMYAHRLI